MSLVEVANISAGGLLVAGGLAGYIRKNSTISLVAGATTGSALIAAGVLSHRQPKKPYGSVLGLTTSALLAIAILAKCKKNSAPLTLKSPSLYVSLTGLVLAAINAAVIYRLQK